MRPARVAAVLLALPALALAQDPGGAPPPARAGPTSPLGSFLLDSIPRDADLVVQTPDLPRFLASAADAGIGTSVAWRDAFRGQLVRWSAGRSDDAALVRGAERLLAMADGEALVASFLLPKVGSSPRRRAVLAGFRSSHGAAELRAAVDEVVEAGLRLRWPASPRTEKVWGREVTALAASFDDLWIRVDDGLVVATDHELALRLLFRGMDAAKRSERAERTEKFRDPTTLVVRHDLPGERWGGVTVLGAETVAFPAAGPALATSVHRPAGGDVMTLALGTPADAPVFPVRVPEEVAVATPGAGAFAVTLRGDGTFAVARPTGGEGAAAAVPGGAPHLGWLRALAAGTIAPPLDTIDAETFAGVLAAAEAARKDAPSFHEWRSGDDPGSVRGPAWHGPTTMLLLRTLAHVAIGRAPGASPPKEIPAPPKPGGSAPPPAPVPPDRR